MNSERVNRIQEAKALVRDYYRDLETATAATVSSVLADYSSDDYQWRGVHPFNEQQGSAAVADVFWKPLLQAWSPIQRREDVFFAGCNDVYANEGGVEQPWPEGLDRQAHCDADGSVWVLSMGHFLGVPHQAWLGIPPTHKMSFLRYADFNCVNNGRIVRSGFFCDIIGVMHQAGINPLPPQTGAAFVYPGPRTHDGLLFEPQQSHQGVASLELVNRMLDDLNNLNKTGLDNPPPEYLARTWCDDMVWYGPSGIGATYTIRGFQAQHQYPFRRGLAGKVFNGHVARFAEGDYACFFGWPNLSNSPIGGFMGLPGSDVKADMRVVDVYRREGDKLAENWVFIDFPWWLKQQGLDILERMQQIVNP